MGELFEDGADGVGFLAVRGEDHYAHYVVDYADVVLLGFVEFGVGEDAVVVGHFAHGFGGVEEAEEEH